MSLEKAKRQRTGTIVALCFIIIFVFMALAMATVVVTAKNVLGGNLTASTETPVEETEAFFTEEVNFVDTDVTEDNRLTLTPTYANDWTDGVSKGLDVALDTTNSAITTTDSTMCIDINSVIQSEQEAAFSDADETHDYSTESSGNFSEEFVDEESTVNVQSSSVDLFSVNVTFDSINADTTVDAIWKMAKKDETYDEEIRKRATESIDAALVEAKKLAGKKENTTSKIVYEYYTDAYGELMLHIMVCDEANTVFVDLDTALGVPSVMGD